MMLTDPLDTEVYRPHDDEVDPVFWELIRDWAWPGGYPVRQELPTAALQLPPTKPLALPAAKPKTRKAKPGKELVKQGVVA